MELQGLTVTTRKGTGKGVARRTRVSGAVPAVLYGDGKENVSLAINARSLGTVLHGKLGEHAIVQLDVTDDPKLSGPALVKEVQHDPVRGQVIHADLMRISLDKKIRVLISVHLEGRPLGVIDGGLLDHQTREVEVECLALDVPAFLTADISQLGIGASLHVSQLVAPPNVTIITSGDRTLAAVHAPRVQVEETTAAAVTAEPAVVGATAAADAKPAEKGKEK